MNVKVKNDALEIADLTVVFHRTLRIPDDDHEYPLPPSMGMFPLRRVDDYADRVPSAWREHGGVFLPMYQREAMWLGFSGSPHVAMTSRAVKVAVGKVNALTGTTWNDELHGPAEAQRQKLEQDYLVAPDQPWLDGINAGAEHIKQFVAMPLGMGYTVEGQVTGEEKFGGVQLLVFPPIPGKIPAPHRVRRGAGAPGYHGMMTSVSSGPAVASASSGPSTFRGPIASMDVHMAEGSLGDNAFTGQEMGLGAGGRMRQKIYPDPYGLEVWNQGAAGRVYVHLVNSAMWTIITGEPMPETPVSAQAYAQHGYPWFDLYDEQKSSIPASETLSAVKSVKEMDTDKGFDAQQDDSSVEIPDEKIVKYAVGAETEKVRDGKW